MEKVSNVIEVIKRVTSDHIVDPRKRRRRLHDLVDIIVIVLCGTLCGCKSWEGIAEFVEDREEWFRKFLVLEHGLPSHDTLSRVFGLLWPDEFQIVLGEIAESLCEHFREELLIAIDGKALRHSFTSKSRYVHTVSAYATGEQGLTLAMIATACKSNEITAIPALLELVDVKNAIVSIDAIGCQTEIAKKIVEKEGDYLLCVKGNQESLHNQLISYFQDTTLENIEKTGYSEVFYQVEKGHGRIEERAYVIVPDIDWIQGRSKWEGLKCIGLKICRRTIGEKVSIEKHYHITSMEPNVSLYSKASRQHWQLEASHHVLDVTFREDDSRIRSDNGPENMAIVRRLANDLLRNEKSTSMTAPRKISKAARSTDYLEKLLCTEEKSIAV